MGTALDEATRKLDMWKSITPTESLQILKATRPLLQVCMFDSICSFVQPNLTIYQFG